MRRLIAALALAVSPAPALAQAEPMPDVAEGLAFPFAPPIGETLRFRFARAHESGGTVRRAGYIYALRFERLGEGYLMHAVMEGLEPGDDAADAAVARQVEPMTGVTLLVELARDGSPLRLRDQPRLWALFVESARRIEAELAHADPATREAAAGLVAGFAAMPPDEQREYLLSPVRPLLAFAGATLPAGSGERRIERAGPAGGRLGGREEMRIVSLDGEAATIEVATRATGADLAAAHGLEASAALEGFGTEEITRYTVSRASGISHAVSQERRTGRFGAGPAQLSIARLEIAILFADRVENAPAAGR